MIASCLIAEQSNYATINRFRQAHKSHRITCSVSSLFLSLSPNWISIHIWTFQEIECDNTNPIDTNDLCTRNSLENTDFWAIITHLLDTSIYWNAKLVFCWCVFVFRTTQNRIYIYCYFFFFLSFTVDRLFYFIPRFNYLIYKSHVKTEYIVFSFEWWHLIFLTIAEYINILYIGITKRLQPA